MVRVTEVTSLAGAVVAVDPPMLDDDIVDDLRLNVAAALHVGVKQVVLTCGTGKRSVLNDGRRLADALGDAEESAISATVISPDVYKPNIISCADGGCVLEEGVGRAIYCGGGDRRPKSWVSVKTGLKFPPPNDIIINMMPFKMGDVMSLPEDLRGYWPIIEPCCEMQHAMDRHRKRRDELQDCGSEADKIWFLTVHESAVSKGTTQRRGGVHIEAPGVVMSDGGRYAKAHWCWGEYTEDYGGGFYMASNVSNSCRLFSAMIKDHPDVVGPLGELEHIRTLLPEGCNMEAGELVWLTDKTPHEAVPVAEDCTRQFIRIVTSSVSAWYENHSTHNPLGIKPDPAITRIVTGDKFEAIREMVRLIQDEGHATVRLFDKPIIDSSTTPISEVPSGEQVIHLSKQGDFVQVRLNGIRYWVGAKNVRPCVELHGQRLRLQQAEGHGSVRVFASCVGGSAMVGEMPSGQEACCVELCNNFVLVQWGESREGWLGAKNVIWPERSA